MKFRRDDAAGLTASAKAMAVRRSSAGLGLSQALPVLVIASLAVVGAGCRQDMHDTPRYEVYEASSTFPDGRASRAAPTGTVARGWLRDDEALYTGKVNGQPVDAIPFPVTHEDLKRGQERFNIYCSPCHGRLGDGNGMVVQRGLRQAANYHQDRLRQERIGYLFDVITNGFGAMQGYAEQVPVRDRWLIAAYVRALQYSQHASVNDVPPDRRGELDRSPGAASAASPGAGTSPPSGTGQRTQDPTKHE